MGEERPVSRENLEAFCRWTGLIGIFTIIAGATGAVLGLFALIIGAIPGIIAVLMGLKLRRTQAHAQRLLYGSGQRDQEELNHMIISLISYFKIQGMLLIIILAVIIISFITGFLGFLFNY